MQAADALLRVSSDERRVRHRAGGFRRSFTGAPAASACGLSSISVARETLEAMGAHLPRAAGLDPTAPPTVRESTRRLARPLRSGRQESHRDCGLLFSARSHGDSLTCLPAVAADLADTASASATVRPCYHGN